MMVMKKIVRWRSKFYGTILERGKEYYRRGMVHDVKVEEDTIRAKVGSTYFYDVLIDVNEDGTIGYMNCDCPFCQSGKNCKHEAAVLFEVENDPDLGKEENKRIYPFKEGYDKKRYFFDMPKITKDLQINEKTYKDALKLLEDGLKLTEFSSGYVDNSDEQVLFCAADFKEKGREFEARACISPTKVMELSCDMPSCRENSFPYYFFFSDRQKKVCAHKLALLLKMNEFILENDPGDKTDRLSMQFLNEFSQYTPKTEDQIKEKSPNIRLVPRLEYDDRMLRVNFRIGNEKMYVLKDLEKLVEKVDNEGIFPLGVRNRLDFSADYFTAESEKAYAFLKEIVNDEGLRSSYRTPSYYGGSEQRFIDGNGNIILYGRRLDDFFDLYNGEDIEFKSRNPYDKKSTYISLAERDPSAYVTIDELRSRDGFEGVKLSANLPELIMGSSYGYFLKNDHLYRVSPDYMKLMSSFRKNSRTNQAEFKIGVNHLGQFYNHVLPRLKERFTVYEDNRALYEQYIPPKPEFVFYFDVVDGNIQCKADVVYGDESYSLFDRGKKNFRDAVSEEAVYSEVDQFFDGYDEDFVAHREGNDDGIYAITEELIPYLLKFAQVNSTPAFDRLRFKRKVSTSVGVRMNNDLLELDIQSDDLSLEELAAVISSYRLKKKYHRLKNGDLIRTDDESIESLDELLSSMNISLKEFVKGKMHLPMYRALYLDKLLEGNDAVYEKRDGHFKQLVDSFDETKEVKLQVPASLDETMRSYQKDGFSWIKTLSHYGFGGILADEMGLGKTIQMIAVLLDEKESGNKGTSLVVCPSSLIYNWINEIRRFAPDLKAVAVTGNQEERKKIIDAYEDEDILVTSYDLLRRDIAHYEGKEFLYEILDEAQYIKTYTTANAKSAKAIRAKRHFALTGTPIENNLSELWSIFDFLMPGLLFPYDTFRKRFEIPISRDNDEAASERLKKMIAPFILRRKKADVLKDLPDKIEETIVVRFSEKQQRLYDSQALKISKTISSEDEDSFRQNKIAILAELMKIRQICCEPSLVFEDYDGESAKREACMELVKNAIAEGHKILLFSQFTSMLEIIEKEFEKEGIAYYKLTGQTGKEERLKMVDSFNQDDVPVFLISLKAGGTGLNLIGADIVIHYDPWWNLAAQDQATDRAHRIGQKHIVSVYKIIAEKTIEEKIVELQELKSGLIENMLSGQSVSLSSMSKSELLELLK